MSLKKLAEHLELSPATVSLVINRSSVADSPAGYQGPHLRGGSKI
jgi:hypothetical protein